MDTAVDQTAENEDQKVSFDQAVEDEKLASETEEVLEESKKKEEDVIDVLTPKAAVKTWKIGPEQYQREYTQRPLSFIGKMQWFALVGEVLDKAMSGPEGLSLSNLFSAPGIPGEVSASSFREADTFVHAIGKLLRVAPNFLIDSYCIWLNVPDYEKELVSEFMKLPPEEGGLTDEQGIEMIEVFIDQNYEALDSFFREGVRNLVNRVQQRAKEAQSHA